MSHTPTPWKLIDEGIIAAQSPTPVKPGGQPNAALLRTPVIALPPVDYPDYSQFKASDWDANAAHIVHCVNVHDQLVAALRMAHNTLAILSGADDPQTWIGEAVQKANQALAAAEKGA